MKTLALISIVLMSSTAFAQEAPENGGIVGPLPPVSSGPVCYKLVQETNKCVVVGPVIFDYSEPRFNVVDLNGAWSDADNKQPYIYFYADAQYSAGYTIRADLTLMNRPDGFGYMLDANTIQMVFPDDRDYTGKIENGNTIRWSNNTVWTKR